MVYDPNEWKSVQKAIYKNAAIEPLPDDVDKSDDDWRTHESRNDWKQMAFHNHHVAATAYLRGMKGGTYTSNDVHLICQGMQLTAEVFANICREHQPKESKQ